MKEVGPTTKQAIRTLRKGFLWVLLLTLAACGAEGDFPDREIRIIVHASPGGISDAVSRYVARHLQEELGVPVVCENRVGAAGSVAFSYVSRSRPDGYTLGYAPVDLAIVQHLGFSQVSPDDFAFLTLHTRAPACLAVRADGPWHDLEELVRGARLSPGKINMATSGTGSIWHLAGLAFGKEAGIELNNVPFPGSGPAVTALLGGHVEAVVAGPSEIQAHVEAGTLRLLGVMSHQRSPIFPDHPTLKEQGLDVEIDAWGGFLAPRGLPSDRRGRLVQALRTVLESDDFERFCRERGLDITILTEEEFHSFVQREYETFGRIVREAGL